MLCARGVVEARALRELLATEVDLEALEAAAQGEWTPPAAGISLDAIETIAAVLSVLRQVEGLAEGIEAAIRLGGDTDTVAAIVAGLLAGLGSDPEVELPWLGLVQLPDASLIDELASGLAERRG